MARIVAGFAFVGAGLILALTVDWVAGVAALLIGLGLLLPFTGGGDDEETMWDPTGFGGGDGGGDGGGG